MTSTLAITRRAFTRFTLAALLLGGALLIASGPARAASELQQAAEPSDIQPDQASPAQYSLPPLGAAGFGWG